MSESRSQRRSPLQVEHVNINSLKPYRNQARTHSKKQVRQLADSVRTFGWTNPILVDDENGVLAGHGRLAAAKEIGMTEVPVIRLSRMTEAEKRAYVLADNKLAENAGWDDDMLRIELGVLSEMELDFELEVMGFETAEIDILIGDAVNDAADEAPAPRPGAEPPVSRIGDLWHLGRHSLLCGDALEPASYATVLGGSRADAVFTDPPFNVPIDGHVSGKGKARHGEFVMASGEMSEEAFSAFLVSIGQRLVESTIDGAVQFVCMDWRHAEPLLTAMRQARLKLLNICVWNKTNGGMGSLYRSKHELVFVLKNGTAAHTNNVELGRHGRNRSNVWDYAGVNAFSKDRDEALAMHPTVKPVKMVADAILDVTKRGDLVLDPFCGSGTTIMAAETTGRRAAAIELDPRYVDVAIRRFERDTGIEAVHVASGRTFKEIAVVRASGSEEVA